MKQPIYIITKLPQEFKDRWITALRSGKYKQAKEALQTEDGYCCLGVAAHLCGYDEDKLMDNTCVLTPREFKAIPEEFGCLRSLQKELAEMNDNGATFNEIADYIEKNL